ncbi:helix-turn-helix domain-containing protein [Dyella nitratireducens]|uniref:AraC family transcriptional regulator n=1 Tax=Dyella nitratireducens TaxID=1849580 RepID=A0ABQ1GPF8_9GAMM|nr:AraC family transcriptional regulator [Dyella nitratireducens]GGA47478.1 AraC family transcriptional regulator [Dyella nitratireducens]GLQ42444.1 AraC family transcriptional regulator [Dyella nitratireducens]
MSADPGKPRGVLHQRLEHGEFQHARRMPSPALACLIEHYWFVSWDLRGLPAQQQETLPHPNVHLVVEPGLTAIYGVHTGRFVRLLEGQGRVFGIKFKAAGFFPFYGAPVSELMDRSLDPGHLFGNDAARFEAEVFASEDVDAMSAAAERLLLAHWPPPDPNVARVSMIVADIAKDRSLTSVEALAQQTGLGKRALQRLFNQYVGVSPKWVINRYRLHEAIAQLQAGAPVAWAELAQQLGYFDQAHFIRDFRKLVGCSPAAYARTEAERGRPD